MSVTLGSVVTGVKINGGSGLVVMSLINGSFLVSHRANVGGRLTGDCNEQTGSLALGSKTVLGCRVSYYRPVSSRFLDHLGAVRRNNQFYPGIRTS